MKQNHINDFHPEAGALINRLLEAGAIIIRGSNGVERFPFTPEPAARAAFLDNLLATDEAYIFVSIAGRRRWLYLILGNSPGELVCDYLVDPVLDKVTSAHYEEWSSKPQPTKFSQHAADLDSAHKARHNPSVV